MSIDLTPQALTGISILAVFLIGIFWFLYDFTKGNDDEENRDN